MKCLECGHCLIEVRRELVGFIPRELRQDGRIYTVRERDGVEDDN